MYVANEVPEELKNPEKAAKLLRIDHSRVHYENGRLTEMLHANLTELSAHQHRQLMLRNNEIKEIRQTVEDYKTIIKTQRTNKGAMRPQTSSVYLSRRKRTPSPSIRRPTYRSTVTPTVQVNDESDSDDSTLYDDDPFRNPRTKSAPAGNRKSSMVSAVSNSSLRSTSVKSGSNVFQTQLGQTPQWLIPNGKQRSAGSLKNGSGKQMNREPEQQFVQFQNEWDEGDGFQMICGGNKTLSRRQLKQLTNVDRIIHDEKRKRYVRHYEALMKNRDERDVLEARVKDFIKSLLDSKLQLRYSNKI